jgi:hypothetical protein
MTTRAAPPQSRAGRPAWLPSRHRRLKQSIRRTDYHSITGESRDELIKRLALEFAPLDVPALAARYQAEDRVFDSREFVLRVTRLWQEVRKARQAPAALRGGVS